VTVSAAVESWQTGFNSLIVQHDRFNRKTPLFDLVPRCQVSRFLRPKVATNEWSAKSQSGEFPASPFKQQPLAQFTKSLLRNESEIVKNITKIIRFSANRARCDLFDVLCDVRSQTRMQVQ